MVGGGVHIVVLAMTGDPHAACAQGSMPLDGGPQPRWRGSGRSSAAANERQRRGVAQQRAEQGQEEGMGL